VSNDDGYTGPKWNWGDPAIKVGVLTEEEILLAKYPSKYQIPFSVLVRNLKTESDSIVTLCLGVQEAINAGKIAWSSPTDAPYIKFRIRTEMTRQRRVLRKKAAKAASLID